MNIEMYARGILILSSLFYALKVFVNESTMVYYTGDQSLKLLYAIFAFTGVFFVTNRDFYLPFLGPTAFPLGLLSPHIMPNDAHTRVNATKLPPNTKVIYWASEPCENTNTCNTKITNIDPFTAYNGFSNAGIAMSDQHGNATFIVRDPQQYHVNKSFMSKTLQPHIHYRYVQNDKLLSKIFTIYINDNSTN